MQIGHAKPSSEVSEQIARKIRQFFVRQNGLDYLIIYNFSNFLLAILALFENSQAGPKISEDVTLKSWKTVFIKRRPHETKNLEKHRKNVFDKSHSAEKL